jgi:hypothetical protein
LRKRLSGAFRGLLEAFQYLSGPFRAFFREFLLTFTFSLGMTDVQEIRIVSNKIDRIEDFALPTQNTVKSLILEGNHILEVPSLAALQDIKVDMVK